MLQYTHLPVGILEEDTKFQWVGRWKVMVEMIMSRDDPDGHQNTTPQSRLRVMSMGVTLQSTVRKPTIMFCFQDDLKCEWEWK